MKKILLALSVLFAFGKLLAQDKALLTGTVTDALSSQPVDLVTVYVKLSEPLELAFGV